MGENHPTFILFARPSLVEGVARLLDFGGTLSVYNDSPSPALADLKALASDSAALAQDGTIAAMEFRRVPQAVPADEPR